MTTLWRAAPAESPYFGRGSYWTPSIEFAQRFRLWLDENVGAPNVVYTATVDVADSMDFPFGLQLDSSNVTRRVPQLAAAGYLWVTFHEAAFEGATVRQYVYLGAQPIQATPTECRSRGAANDH